MARVAQSILRYSYVHLDLRSTISLRDFLEAPRRLSLLTVIPFPCFFAMGWHTWACAPLPIKNWTRYHTSFLQSDMSWDPSTFDTPVPSTAYITNTVPTSETQEFDDRGNPTGDFIHRMAVIDHYMFEIHKAVHPSHLTSRSYVLYLDGSLSIASNTHSHIRPSMLELPRCYLSVSTSRLGFRRLTCRDLTKSSRPILTLRTLLLMMTVYMAAAALCSLRYIVGAAAN